jgi:hypothetical protein
MSGRVRTGLCSAVAAAMPVSVGPAQLDHATVLGEADPKYVGASHRPWLTPLVFHPFIGLVRGLRLHVRRRREGG